jgi:hypothetical protein
VINSTWAAIRHSYEHRCVARNAAQRTGQFVDDEGHGGAVAGKRRENKPYANPTFVGRATAPATMYRWDMNGGTDQFQACEFRDGSGWNVLASLPGHAPAQLSGFGSEAEALAWIETRATGMRAPSSVRAP